MKSVYVSTPSLARLLIWVGCGAMLGLFSVLFVDISRAQETALDGDAKVRHSVDIIFNVKTAEIQSSPLFNNVRFQNLIDIEGDDSNALNELFENTLESVVGGIQLPDLRRPNRPRDMMLDFRFEDAEAAKRLRKFFEKGSSKPPLEISGVSFVHVGTVDVYGDVYAGSILEKSVLIGTQAYLRTTRKSTLFTQCVLNTWKTLPKSSIRVALNFQTTRSSGLLGLFANALGDRPEWREVISTLELVDCIGIAVDLKQEGLASIKVVPENEKAQQSLRSGLDGLLFASRMAIQKSLASTGFKDAEVDAAIFSVVEQLQTSQIDGAIEISVSRPTNADQAIKGLNAIIRNSLDQFKERTANSEMRAAR